MHRALIVPPILMLALSACGRSGDSFAQANMTADNASAAAAAPTVETTGSPSSIGAYGPGLVTTPNFVDHAAISDMYEIQASKIALARSKSAAIRDFAQQMVTAHTETSAKLKAAIADGKAEAPLPTALDPAHARLIEELEKAKPEKFDRTYADQQTSAHREALGLLDSYATHGDNAALKAFAAQTKPHVQEHLALITALDHSGADETTAR